MRVRVLVLIALVLSSWSIAQASSYSFSGALPADDAVWILAFVPSASVVYTFTTTSFADGGFTPILTLFNSTGGYQFNSTPTDGCTEADPFVGCWDSSFGYTLAADSMYFLTVTEEDNYPTWDNLFGDPGLYPAFTRLGQGNFTGPVYGTGEGSFIALGGWQRTANFSFDISSSGDLTVPIPEPSAALLSLCGFGLLGGVSLLRRRRS